MALIRWSGASAAAGGVFLIAFSVLVAARPEGCIGEGCLNASTRSYGDLAPLVAAALVLIAVGFAGLALRARATGGRAPLWKWGSLLATAGVAAIILGVASNAVSENLPPFFVVPGLIGLVGGFLLISGHIFRAKILPPWSGWLLLIGTFALAGANDQNAQILFTVPFGLAWIAIGLVLWRDRGQAIAATTSRGSMADGS